MMGAKGKDLQAAGCLDVVQARAGDGQKAGWGKPHEGAPPRAAAGSTPYRGCGGIGS